MKRILKVILCFMLVFPIMIFTACSSSTPYIGENGNWWIGETDTNVKAEGAKGETGASGEKGEDGKTPYIGENGNWWIGETDTNVKAEGKNFYDDNEEGFDFYLLDDGTYAVGMGLSKYLSVIKVPSSYNDKEVTMIADDGWNSKYIKEIYIPNSVKYIGENAFKNCSNLQKVYIENKEVEIFNAQDGEVATILESDIKCGPYAFANGRFSTINIYNSNDGDTLVDCLSINTTNILKLEVEVSHDDNSIKYRDTLNASYGELNGNLNFGNFGLFNNVSVKVYLIDGRTFNLNLSPLSVTSDHYNIALLNGTYPVLVYSLKINDITEGGNIPTFIALERNAAYDFEELPMSVYIYPNMSYSMATSGNFHGMRKYIQQYVSELYNLNQNSKFTLYAVDNYPEFILEFLVANRIPEENWNCVLLSDGAGTAGILSETFSTDNNKEIYSQMVKDWNQLKEYVYKNGYSSSNLLQFISQRYENDSIYSILARYPYVIVKTQSNVKWWVNRLRVNENLSKINEKDAEMAQDIVSSTVSYYTNNLLKALTDEQKIEFKKLYKFNDEMFSEAEKQNKKVMVILGTSWDGEKDTFYEYIKLTMLLYGNEYLYYYKGHPGYPTSTYPKRQEFLEKLNNEGYSIYELDNAIAAEVIMFYNPSIYLSGWPSSTYDSVENQQMACTLYNVDISEKNSYTYGKKIDSYITKFVQNTTSYSNIKLISEHQYYLIQYNNENFENQIDEYKKHEIAIFDSTNNTIKYYKLSVEGIYEETNK